MPLVLIVQNNKGFKEKYLCVCVCVCVRERERERSFEVMGYCLHLLRSCGGLDGVEGLYGPCCLAILLIVAPFIHVK